MRVCWGFVLRIWGQIHCEYVRLGEILQRDTSWCAIRMAIGVARRYMRSHLGKPEKGKLGTVGQRTEKHIKYSVHSCTSNEQRMQKAHDLVIHDRNWNTKLL